MTLEYPGTVNPALLASSSTHLASPLVDHGAASPTILTQDRDESEEPRRRPLKRRLSPSAPTPPSRSPAPQPADPTDISNPPVLIPHTLSLPDSAFDFYATRSHPFNKLGFRYTPCGPSPGTPLPVPPQRSIESYPPGVRWSWEDRSPFTLLTEDARTLTTDKGWRAARSVVGVREGAWYWEVKVERGGGDGGRDKGGEGEGSWVRVGVGRRESPLNAPVGIDGYSYGFRDKTGDSVTLAQPQPYGAPYGTSHTIGVYISLPARPPAPPVDKRDPARIVRKRIPIRYKGQLYFEQLEHAPSKEMDELLVDPALKAFKDRQAEEKRRKAKAAAPGTRAPPAAADDGPPLRPLPRLEGSKVAFFVDGVCQGVAFEDLYDFVPLRRDKPPPGTSRKKDSRALMENHHDDGALGYFPMVSVFGGGIATLNPGPDFAFPPPADMDAALAASPHPPKPPTKRSPADAGQQYRPLCERYAEAMAEQAYLDDLDEQAAVRLFLETQRAAAAAAASAASAAAAAAAVAPPAGTDGTGASTPSSTGADGPSKKAKTAAAAAAAAEAAAAAASAAASGKLATLGVVQASGTAAVSMSGESPLGSPRPGGTFGGGEGVGPAGEVKME